jgi:hypothetical protein
LIQPSRPGGADAGRCEGQIARYGRDADPKAWSASGTSGKRGRRVGSAA